MKQIVALRLPLVKCRTENRNCSLFTASLGVNMTRIVTYIKPLKWYVWRYAGIFIQERGGYL
ncbi:MAG: hypothetical protein Q7S46_07620 [Gallionella sp.]|nr:hypothetical protein [Gallionella sp.]